MHVLRTYGDLVRFDTAEIIVVAIFKDRGHTIWPVRYETGTSPNEQTFRTVFRVYNIPPHLKTFVRYGNELLVFRHMSERWKRQYEKIPYITVSECFDAIQFPGRSLISSLLPTVKTWLAVPPCRYDIKTKSTH